MKRLFALASIGLSIAGCTSITVRHVTPDQPNVKGVRYSLPKPFLLMTPAENGSVSAKIIYLPDPDHTYAIDASTFAGTYELQTKLSQEGFLESVRFSLDDSATAAKFAEAAGDTAASLIDQQQKAANEAAAARAAQQQKLVDSVLGGFQEYTTAHADLSSAQAAMVVAEADVRAAEDALVVAQQAGDGEKIAEAEASLVDARNRRTTAEPALKVASDKEAAAIMANLLRFGGASATLPAGNIGDSPTPKKAFGPALFAINDSCSIETEENHKRRREYHPQLVAVKYPKGDALETNGVQLSYHTPDSRPTKGNGQAPATGDIFLLDTTAKPGANIKINVGKMDVTSYEVKSTIEGAQALKVKQVGSISSDGILTLHLPADAPLGKYVCTINNRRCLTAQNRQPATLTIAP